VGIKSRSGRKFTKVGVKQRMVKGSLVRSIGYGSRICQVITFVNVEGVRRVVLRHYCNTSHFKVPNPYAPRSFYTVDIKGNSHRPMGELGMSFLGWEYGWEVVREVQTGN
jgi:hypothetical protein